MHHALLREAGNETVHQKRAWTHELCVGAPHEASCFLRLFEGVFAPLPSTEKPKCVNMSLGPTALRSCVYARFLCRA